MGQVWGFDFWEGQETFVFSTIYRLALGPNQREYLGVKWLGYEFDHFCPSSAKVKNGAMPPFCLYGFVALIRTALLCLHVAVTFWGSITLARGAARQYPLSSSSCGYHCV